MWTASVGADGVESLNFLTLWTGPCMSSS